MGAGSLKDWAAQRGIGSGVCVDGAFERFEVASLVTTKSEIQIHWMALGVNNEAFLSCEFNFDRPFEKVGCQGCMVLNRHVFLAAKAATHQHADTAHPVAGKLQHVGYLPQFVIDALAGSVDGNSILFFVVSGNSTLDFHKGMLCVAGRELKRDGVGTLCQFAFGVSTPDVLVEFQV